MTTSENSSFPNRLTKIDELTRPLYYYLNEDDVCYYYGDYSSGEGWAIGPTNQFIFNLKCPVSKKNTGRWHYKKKAIDTAAVQLSNTLGANLGRMTLVPIPPSKVVGHEDYDDRIWEILDKIVPPQGISKDVRKLVLQNKNSKPAHESINRPNPDEKLENYTIDESLTEPEPEVICVVDDVLTTGCSFRAMSNLLKSRFPKVKIIGLFMARVRRPLLSDD